MKRPKNILFIIADDWSPIAGVYGNGIIQTPHIDALGRAGTVFDHAYCTTPSCAASRANILTGHYSHTHGQFGHCHGIHGFTTHPWIPTLPGILRPRGVTTGLLGKDHVAPHSIYPFDILEGMNTRNVSPLAQRAGEFFAESGERPFYLHIGSAFPHRAGRGFGNEHVGEGIKPVGYDPGDVAVPSWLPDAPEVREDIADYYEAVSRYDQTVGAVIEALEKSGKRDQTLIIVTTDHAMPFPGAKASSFDSGHRCPLIVWSPHQAKRCIRSQAMVNWSDFLPTFLDVFRVEYPRDAAVPLPGRSWLDILEDTSSEPGGGEWSETFTAHNFHEVTNYYPYRVLRKRRWKYVLNLACQIRTPMPSDLFRSKTWTAVREQDITMLGDRPRSHFEFQPEEALYDMESDPVEAENRIGDPTLTALVAECRRKLLAFREATRDPWLEQDFQEGRIARYSPGDSKTGPGR